MGLFSKIKNILFEEEEIEVPVKEVKKIEKVEKKEEVILPKPEEKLEKAKQVVKESEDVNLFDSEPTFNFPDFDEDEFENTLPKYKEEPKKEEPQKLYFEHQRELKKEEPKKEELRHKSDLRSIGRGYSPLDKGLKDNTPKKFVPSPIISPVYGILDKDYHPDDISTREDTDLKRNKLDVDTVRKKAFEPKPVKEEKELPKKVEEEPVEEKQVKEPIPEVKKEEKPKKSVDELLADSAEEVVAVDENLNVENNIKEIEDELDKIDDELVLDEKPKEKDEDDTLEQDLFELIDSMYEDDKEDE